MLSRGARTSPQPPSARVCVRACLCIFSLHVNFDRKRVFVLVFVRVCVCVRTSMHVWINEHIFPAREDQVKIEDHTNIPHAFPASCFPFSSEQERAFLT
jgi:hypothetical protein